MLQFEDAAKEAADEATSPRPLGEEEVQDIQVMLKMEGNSIQIRQLKVGEGGEGELCCAVDGIKCTIPLKPVETGITEERKQYRTSLILKLQFGDVCNCDSDCMLL